MQGGGYTRAMIRSKPAPPPDAAEASPDAIWEAASSSSPSSSSSQDPDSGTSTETSSSEASGSGAASSDPSGGGSSSYGMYRPPGVSSSPPGSTSQPGSTKGRSGSGDARQPYWRRQYIFCAATMPSGGGDRKDKSITKVTANLEVVGNLLAPHSCHIWYGQRHARSACLSLSRNRCMQGRRHADIALPELLRSAQAGPAQLDAAFTRAAFSPNSANLSIAAYVIGVVQTNRQSVPALCVDGVAFHAKLRYFVYTLYAVSKGSQLLQPSSFSIMHALQEVTDIAPDAVWLQGRQLHRALSGVQLQGAIF